MYTKENYEEHVVDYLDGKMSAKEESEFLAFLKAHPEIEQEVESIGEMELTADNIQFPEKDELFKLKPADKFVFSDSFEQASIAYFEGDLDEEQKVQLEKLIEHNDSFRNSFETFSKVYLEPDKNIEFTRKSSLKKLTVAQKRNRILTAISSVAAVVVLATIFFNPSANQEINRVSSDQVMKQEKIELEKIKPYSANYLSENHSIPEPKIITYHNQESFPEQHPDLSLPLVASITGQIPNNAIRHNLILPAVKDGSVTDEFLSIGEFARERWLSGIISGDKENRQAVNLFWNLAMAGVEGIGSLTDTEIYIEKKTNQSGEIERYTLETAVFGLSTPVRND